MTVRNLIFLLIFSVIWNSQAQKADISHIALNDSTIYFFCRGGKAKAGMIADKFNIQDPDITHVGIGLYENNNIKIYNITDTNPQEQNAFIIEDVESFLSGNVYYFSIWKCDNNVNDFKKIKDIFSEYQNRKLKFDYGFSLDDDEKMYCSEFCAKAIIATNPEKFKLKTTKIMLDEFHKAFLERSELEYYPVDFFEEISTLVFEQRIITGN